MQSEPTEPTEQVEEKKIAIRACYIGKKPALSEPEKPFFLGPMKITEGISSENEEVSIGLGKGLRLNVIADIQIIFGSLVVIDETYKVGFNPGTQLALFNVPMSVAESLNGIENWRFERLSWTKYRQLIYSKYQNLKAEKEILESILTKDWNRFFPLEDDGLLSPSKIEIQVGNRGFQIAIMEGFIEMAEVMEAVEYFEHGLVCLDYPPIVKVFGGQDGKTILYKTPEQMVE